MRKYLEWYGAVIIRVFTVIFAVVSLFLFAFIPVFFIPAIALNCVFDYGLPVIITLLLLSPLIIKCYDIWLTHGDVVCDWLLDLL